MKKPRGLEGGGVGFNASGGLRRSPRVWPVDWPGQGPIASPRACVAVVDVSGLGPRNEVDQVAQGPGDLVAPALVVTVVPLCGAEEGRQLTGDWWLLGEHDPHATLASAILPTHLQHRSASAAWERARDSTVFKIVAPVDGTTVTASGLRHIDDRLSLSQPYASPDMPSDLAAVVNRWHRLPDVIRAGILAMVKTAAKVER